VPRRHTLYRTLSSLFLGALKHPPLQSTFPSLGVLSNVAFIPILPRTPEESNLHRQQHSKPTLTGIHYYYYHHRHQTHKMSRYSLANALLYLITIVNNARAHESTETDYGPWSYLPVKIPTPLSDMSVDKLTLDGNTEQSIILTGGCDSADGNVYYEADWGEGFACSSVTSKVSPCCQL
jgi:hypothetical protein